MLDEYYKRLHADCGKVMSDSLALEDDGRLYRAHHAIKDFNSWVSVLEPPERHLLYDAVLSYSRALLALLQGQYASAFIQLRLFLELGLACVYYSAYRVDLHLFDSGITDLHWATFIDKDRGVFSPNFARAFNEDLLENVEDYRGLAERTYRLCSEYVHGNTQAYRSLPQCATFSREHYVLWHDLADSARAVILFALSLRWLRLLPVDSLRRIEQCVYDELGHLSGIRLALGGPVEGE